MPAKRKTVKRSLCCGVPLNIPYQPTGCPHCNPIFWGAVGPVLYAGAR